MLMLLVKLSNSFISFQFFPYCKLLKDNGFCLFFSLFLICTTLNFQSVLLADSKDMILNCNELFIVQASKVGKEEWHTLIKLIAIPPEFHMAASFPSFKSFKCYLNTEVFSDHQLYWDILVPQFMFFSILYWPYLQRCFSLPPPTLI